MFWFDFLNLIYVDRVLLVKGVKGCDVKDCIY